MKLSNDSYSFIVNVTSLLFLSFRALISTLRLMKATKFEGMLLCGFRLLVLVMSLFKISNRI